MTNLTLADLGAEIETNVRKALAEDVGAGDITAQLIPAERLAHAKVSEADERSKDDNVKRKILGVLGDGEYHFLTELNSLHGIDRNRMDSVLRRMAQEEEIEISLGKVKLTEV